MDQDLTNNYHVECSIAGMPDVFVRASGYKTMFFFDHKLICKEFSQGFETPYTKPSPENAENGPNNKSRGHDRVLLPQAGILSILERADRPSVGMEDWRAQEIYLND